MNVCIDQHSEARPNLAAYYQVYRAVAAERRLTLVDHEPLWAVSLCAAHAGSQRNAPDFFGNRLAARVRSSGSANAGWTRTVPLVLPGRYPSGPSRLRDGHHSEHHRFVRATCRRRASYSYASTVRSGIVASTGELPLESSRSAASDQRAANLRCMRLSAEVTDETACWDRTRGRWWRS